MHDLLLDDVTNIASLLQYSDRKTTKEVEGKNITGYFVSDFSFSELQDLKLLQRLPQRTTLYNGMFNIPNFTSIINLVQSYYSSNGQIIGIYPELKHPSFFNALGFPVSMEDMLLAALNDSGYEVFGDDVPTNLSQVLPVVIQCFDPAPLQYMVLILYYHYCSNHSTNLVLAQC